MLVPYFGPLTDPDNGELRKSDPFFDMGSKIYFNIKLNGAKLQVFAGIKNIFNSFQSDFDSGIDRDPAYVYGPASPRTVYFGIKTGNELPSLMRSGYQHPETNIKRHKWRGNKHSFSK
jgi:outer membrane receptor for ferrienterochelin and colicins